MSLHREVLSAVTNGATSELDVFNALDVRDRDVEAAVCLTLGRLVESGQVVNHDGYFYSAVAPRNYNVWRDAA